MSGPLDPRMIDEMEANVEAEAAAYQVSWLAMALELEQVKKERDLLQLSVNGLRESCGKFQRLAAVRLARAKKAETALHSGEIKTRKRVLTNKEYKDA